MADPASDARASEQEIREKLIEERTDQSGLSRMNLASYGIEANFRLEDSENARRDKANTFAHLTYGTINEKPQP